MTGLMWYFGKGDALVYEVRQAMRSFEKRFDVQVTHISLDPADADAAGNQVEGLVVVRDKDIQRGYFWLTEGEE